MRFPGHFLVAPGSWKPSLGFGDNFVKLIFVKVNANVVAGLSR
jgi:hypothetical protein